MLAAAHGGDPAAFERIFTALSPVVEGYLALQGAAEPEDLTSEVFLGVLRNIRSFTGDEQAFRSWVFTIAHRRLLDDRRRRSRMPQHEPLAAASDPRSQADVEATVGDVLAREQVEALCRRISPDQRDVLLMRLVAGLTVDEVAATLDRSPGAVKALQRRGLRAVGRLIEREGVPL